MQPPEGVPHRLPEHWWSPKVTVLAYSFSVALFILSRLCHQQFCSCMISSPLSSNRSPNHVFTDDVISDEIDHMSHFSGHKQFPESPE